MFGFDPDCKERSAGAGTGPAGIRVLGRRSTAQISDPVNRFPDFIRYIVQRLKVRCTVMGKAKIAQVLSSAGLHLVTFQGGLTTTARAHARPVRHAA